MSFIKKIPVNWTDALVGARPPTKLFVVEENPHRVAADR
jgi:hypothetical protein